MAKQERKVDDVHQVTLAPNETKSNEHDIYNFMTYKIYLYLSEKKIIKYFVF